MEETLSLFTNFMTCEGDISTFLFRKLTLASNGLGIDFVLTDPAADVFEALKVQTFKKQLFFSAVRSKAKITI